MIPSIESQTAHAIRAMSLDELCDWMVADEAADRS